MHRSKSSGYFGARHFGARHFAPMLWDVLRGGYNWQNLRADILAGLSVSIVALPLSMALSIASGATPERGLFTAIVAGFLISMLGGSRYQIGGPTGAFVVLVFATIQHYGYDGLVLATLMAGGMLILFGLTGLGNIIRYIPYPLITGFTSGIGVIIATTQIKDLLGLHIEHMPGDFIGKWQAYMTHLSSTNVHAIIVGGLAFGIILLIRRYRPALPAYLLAPSAAAILVAYTGWDVATIGTQFGGIPHSLPSPSIPTVSIARLQELVPSAFTIAFLAALESLLSAVVADSMSSSRHKPNCELIAQGVANIGSVLLGGLPATGAIARTATNIRSGAFSPLAGMLHALFLLLFILLFARLASWLPLASLAAILLVVAWDMSEPHKFVHLFRAPKSDVLVLLTTFLLTILVDLTTAIQVGIVLASILFVKRMVEVAELKGVETIFSYDAADDGRKLKTRRKAPPGIQIYEVSGPLFFGIAARLTDVLDHVLGDKPQVLILRMRAVPVLDASAAHSLRMLAERCHKHGIQIVISGANPSILSILQKMHIGRLIGADNFAPNMAAALQRAHHLQQTS